MRKIILTIALICPLLLTAQTANDLESIKSTLDVLFKHVETNNIDILQPYLTEEVKVSGYDGKTALAILNSIPLQIKPPSSYKIEKIQQVDNNWKINVNAIVSKEPVDYDFVLSRDFKFLEINMVKVQIKKEAERL